MNKSRNIWFYILIFFCFLFLHVSKQLFVFKTRKFFDRTLILTIFKSIKHKMFQTLFLKRQKTRNINLTDGSKGPSVQLLGTD